MGTLRIHGFIDLSQFWPLGSSDADTTKIQLLVDKNSFEYKETGTRRFLPTDAFNDAISKGQGSKPVIKTNKEGISSITIRLQGVDAPELHYKAAPLRTSNAITKPVRDKFNAINKEERRQLFAQSSTMALAKHLEGYQGRDGLVKCYFVTETDYPYEVIDTYGRFVGNICLKGNQDINLWLIENGWGFPTFYTSMSQDEIQKFLDAWEKGKKINNRPSTNISNDASYLDWECVYEKPNSNIQFGIGEDAGPVVMPKIFRRQVAWAVQKKAGVITKSTKFKAYLKKSVDQLVLLEDFLENGLESARVCSLHEFITEDNEIEVDPEELVFQEKPGTLVDSNGNKILIW
jgi:endonuclease YncB( thermonuclease family)